MTGILDYLNSFSEYAPGSQHTPYTGITIGTIVDTNDFEQMGRLRVACPALGDPDIESDVFNTIDIPWASYCSPFIGFNRDLRRGPDYDQSTGPIAYGLWAIPNKNDYALIMCINGDPSRRIWVGCLPPQYMQNTLPHGRYNLDNDEGELTGPLTSSGDPIEPLYTNLSSQFGSTGGRKKFEWLTRGADYTATAVDPLFVDRTVDSSRNADDKQEEVPRHRQGYGTTTSVTSSGFDNQVYSFTSPGFHSLSMDDRPENCRVRLRTTTGHQIILDDSNERIFVGTNTGEVFLEMDAAGNVDLHAERHIAFHCKKDMNLSSDGAIRLRGKQGVHIISDDEIRMNAVNDIHTISTANIRTTAAESMFDTIGLDYNLITGTNINISSGADTHIKGGANVNVESTSDTNVKGGVNVNVESTSDTNVKGGVNVNLEAVTGLNAKGGATLNVESLAVNILGSTTMNLSSVTMGLNGSATLNIDSPGLGINAGGSGPASPAGTAGSATSANLAVVAQSLYAYSTSRVPFKLNNDEIPWSRGMLDPTKTDKDTVINTDVVYDNYDFFEYSYNNVNVGQVELKESLKRGSNWKR